MAIAGVSIKRPRRVLGIDSSTNSFAYCIIEDGEPVDWGEIPFKGSTVFKRLADGRRKIEEVKSKLHADVVVIESSIFVQNKKTVILMAYAVGAILSVLMDTIDEVDEVSPKEWQSAIGNMPLSKAEKESIKLKTPGKSKSWYDNQAREQRKQFTMDWVREKFGIAADTDNISDAVALASYYYDKRQR